MNERIERVSTCKERLEYLANTRTSDETIFRRLAHTAINDMPFNELAILFDFSKIKKGASKGSVDFKAHLIVGHREDIFVPTSEQLIALEASALRGCTKRVTSTAASFLKTLRDLSGVVVVAVGVMGLFAEYTGKIPAKEVPTLMALAACSAICCALSIWGLKVWYPKNERND